MGIDDPRFKLSGIKQLSDLVFEIYRGGERACEWLEETPLDCGIVRDWVEPPSSIFSLRVLYGPTSLGKTYINEPYSCWKVTFFDEGQAALFKLTFL